MTDRFLIIGGGIRLEKACEALKDEGYSARVYTGKEPLKNAIDSSDIILLGLPASSDGVNVNSAETEVSLRDIAALCSRNKLVLGGRLSEKVKALFDIYSVRWADYSMSPEFEVLNAVPTAEGAIQIAMEEFPFTICSSQVFVTGYGKVSKALSNRLKALGAHVTVVARSEAARAEAESQSLTAIDFAQLPDRIRECQILFNTVPATVLTKQVLSAMNPSAGIIDLASKPGGVDLDAAKTCGITVIWALSLPGKVAPVTAGRIIQKTACNIVRDLTL